MSSGSILNKKLFRNLHLKLGKILFCNPYSSRLLKFVFYSIISVFLSKAEVVCRNKKALCSLVNFDSKQYLRDLYFIWQYA